MLTAGFYWQNHLVKSAGIAGVVMPVKKRSHLGSNAHANTQARGCPTCLIKGILLIFSNKLLKARYSVSAQWRVIWSIPNGSILNGSSEMANALMVAYIYIFVCISGVVWDIQVNDLFLFWTTWGGQIFFSAVWFIIWDTTKHLKVLKLGVAKEEQQWET